ncbi:nuclear transport factor 2 family protein [Uliginosibacterium sp. 31-16]|uniref:nuclear transport factor 2 family protein n=1 Tax=Uliginosibacterium sp. 31-16 TaxID=3068315 RepID=UPI00273F70FF|nr:nuclear transport factor 2 family protein [Uliginosibacterium sp. 31-16]MDP5238717.1 nuclear transport factor 2 family protein [Uliginosibacterium sp. 31-16]
MSSISDLGAEKDRAILHKTVRDFGAFADDGAFDRLAALFAPRITLDYSSLTGQPASTLSSTELMAQWASLLPGFDLTCHAINIPSADIRGVLATVEAAVCADHFIADQWWQVQGCYEFVFHKIDGAWKIETLRFHLTGESGSRDVLALAVEAVLRRKPRTQIGKA